MHFFKAIRILLLLCLLSFTIYAQQVIPRNPDWSKPYKPFRIVGNLYYVGTYDLACYLVTTPQGHILINAALDSTVDLLKANVEVLGFRFADIKILLTSQGHMDHVGGMAEIQRLTGANVMINAPDVPVVTDGGHSDFIYGGLGVGSLFPPVKVDRILQDHDTITLADTKIEMLNHPGHTKGSCSYMLTVRDERRRYRVLIANVPFMLPEVTLPSMPAYPGVAKDFQYTLATMKKLKFDLWMAAHSSQFDLHEKRKEGDPYNPLVFGDKKNYYRMIADMKEIYAERLKAVK